MSDEETADAAKPEAAKSIDHQAEVKQRAESKVS
jgi:hypothetical protein